ncbi:sulfatase [Thermoactinospora rubra]|uniref:sulfatase family protein n=1 Tax=Thermoactinospora rubra TaxID=1088767 RepID=UPI001F0A92D8|nr:sulfatase [Thermoactinospora rubra]
MCILMLLVVAAEPLAASGRVQPAKPNIILILTDDLDYGNLEHFPNISNLLVRRGLSFDRYFVTNSWCCPSRASILRSQHVHSHGVLTNTAPEGGFDRFTRLGLERSTIGTWMQAAGYRTAMMGKYLNHYPGEAAAPTYVPPGWNDWHVPVRGLYESYGYTLNSNGRLADYGWAEQDYIEDVLTAKAKDFITASDQPFFLYLAPIAPHNPANPAVRHATAFSDLKAPRPPSFNQDDVSREPGWLRSRPKIKEAGIAAIDDRYRRRMRAMLGVDDMVGSLLTTLDQAGKLSDTYVFFASDNGFHLGTHRLKQGKTTPFEESIHVPLVVRGPGVAPGVVRDLTANIDLAPTFAELGGAAPPAFAEGRSLVPFLKGRRPDGWRRHVLVEFFRPENRISARQTPVPPYAALRTDRYTYVHYVTGERQLYDLTADPYQLDNLAATADPELLARLESLLQAMRGCSGAGCRTADQLER